MTTVARLPADTSLSRGDPVSLRLEPEKLHFFDLDHGVFQSAAFTTFS